MPIDAPPWSVVNRQQRPLQVPGGAGSRGLAYSRANSAPVSLGLKLLRMFFAIVADCFSRLGP